MGYFLSHELYIHISLCASFFLKYTLLFEIINSAALGLTGHGIFDLSCGMWGLF